MGAAKKKENYVVKRTLHEDALNQIIISMMKVEYNSDNNNLDNNPYGSTYSRHKGGTVSGGGTYSSPSTTKTEMKATPIDFNLFRDEYIYKETIRKENQVKELIEKNKREKVDFVLTQRVIETLNIYVDKLKNFIPNLKEEMKKDRNSILDRKAAVLKELINTNALDLDKT